MVGIARQKIQNRRNIGDARPQAVAAAAAISNQTQAGPAQTQPRRRFQRLASRRREQQLAAAGTAVSAAHFSKNTDSPISATPKYGTPAVFRFPPQSRRRSRARPLLQRVARVRLIY
jgi:hypothetical protein